jgi:hypothetical protein
MTIESTPSLLHGWPLQGSGLYNASIAPNDAAVTENPTPDADPPVAQSQNDVLFAETWPNYYMTHNQEANWAAWTAHRAPSYAAFIQDSTAVPQSPNTFTSMQPQLFDPREPLARTPLFLGPDSLRCFKLARNRLNLLCLDGHIAVTDMPPLREALQHLFDYVLQKYADHSDDPARHGPPLLAPALAIRRGDLSAISNLHGDMSAYNDLPNLRALITSAATAVNAVEWDFNMRNKVTRELELLDGDMAHLAETPGDIGAYRDIERKCMRLTAHDFRPFGGPDMRGVEMQREASLARAAQMLKSLMGTGAEVTEADVANIVSQLTVQASVDTATNRTKRQLRRIRPIELEAQDAPTS